VIHFIDRECRPVEKGEVEGVAEMHLACGARCKPMEALGDVYEVRDCAELYLFVYTSAGKLRFMGESRKRLLEGVKAVLAAHEAEA